MAQKITLSGNLFIQMAGEAKPSPIPLLTELDYTEKSVNDYSWPSAQTNVALNQGTVTAPRFIVMEVTEGDVSISTSAVGAGAVKLSANPTPQPGDSPARLIFFTFAAATAQFYITTSGPAKAKIWFFE